MQRATMEAELSRHERRLYVDLKWIDRVVCWLGVLYLYLQVIRTWFGLSSGLSASLARP